MDKLFEHSWCVLIYNEYFIVVSKTTLVLLPTVLAYILKFSVVGDKTTAMQTVIHTK